MKLSQIIRIKPEDDAITIYKEVLDGSFFVGANLWTLVGAMIIACVGLNYDSTMALIGAMIISPLMGPVIGLGFGFAVRHKGLLRSCIKHWLIAVTFCLIASTLFFIVSPFKKPTDQIIAFATPTFFDCLLAFVGGLIGMLAIIRKDGTKVLAGVAVATACLPPLCTVGFGVATFNMELILGGLYFYLLNCIYIGLGTFVLTRILRIRLQGFASEKISNASIVLLTVVSLLFAVPGVWVAFKLYQKNANEQHLEAYIHDVVENENTTIVKITHKQNKKIQVIDVVLTGTPLGENVIKKMEDKLPYYGFDSAKLELHYTDTRVLYEELKKMKSELKELKQKDSSLHK